MRFTPFDDVPPTTALRDLFTTSLLVHTDSSNTGVLVRCSAGVDEGSALVVHAGTGRPNAVRMLQLDDETPIGVEARALLPDPAVRVVAIPHISWHHLLPRGRPWRITAVVTGVLASLIPLSLMRPPLSAAVAIPISALVGLLIWLVLRQQVPTSITPVDGLELDPSSIVAHVLSQKTAEDVPDSTSLGATDA